MMNVNFPAVDEIYIKQKVESGFYSNATELVRDAVRRMRRPTSSGKPYWLLCRSRTSKLPVGIPGLTPALFEEIKRKCA